MSNTYGLLEADLRSALYQPPHVAVEIAIGVYSNAKAHADEANRVADAAKKLIADVMAETGQTKYGTAAGTVAMTAPSVTVSYDAKALDILLRDDADLAMRLAPYRKETERAGTMRITAGK